MTTTTSKTGHGGARPGSGPAVRRIQMSRESALELRILCLARLGKAGAEDAERMVAALIHQAWLEYDAEIQAAAEMVAEAEWSDEV